MLYSGVRLSVGGASLSTLLVTILVLAGGCSSTEGEGPAGPNPPAKLFAHETVEQSAVNPKSLDDGKVDKFKDGMERVIRDPDEFESLRQDLHAGGDEDSEDAGSEEVDFSEEIVVVKVLGKRPSDEYEVSIRNIAKRWSSGRSLVSISVTEIEPGPNCSASGTEVIPYHIVKTDKFSADRTSFKNNGVETKDCS